MLRDVLVPLTILVASAGLTASNAQAAPNFAFKPHVEKFVAQGNPAGKYGADRGTFADKLFWYYEPNIDPATGKGWIRFEFTDGTSGAQAYFGHLALQGEDGRHHLGALLDILDGSGHSLYSHVFEAVMDTRGKAIAVNVAFPHEEFVQFKNVVIHPFTIERDYTPEEMGPFVTVTIGGDGPLLSITNAAGEGH